MGVRAARGTLTRLTTDEAVATDPLWSRDGRRVAFSSSRDGPLGVFWKSAEASAVLPYDWSPDGATLFVQATFPETSHDIGLVSVEEPGPWEPLIQTTAEEWSPALSPDGRWLAYTSNETGRHEVYVQRFPELEGRTVISVGGGLWPSWSADGRELFYARGAPPDALMRVTLDVDDSDPPSLRVLIPERLFDWRFYARPDGRRHYDVSPDGQRFLLKAGRTSTGRGGREINIVVNWNRELLERVPVE